jgi:hypothetical protein
MELPEEGRDARDELDGGRVDIPREKGPDRNVVLLAFEQPRFLGATPKICSLQRSEKGTRKRSELSPSAVGTTCRQSKTG